MGSTALPVLQCGFAEPDWGLSGICGLPVGHGQPWPTQCSIRSGANGTAVDLLCSLWCALLQELGQFMSRLKSRVLGRGGPVQGLLIYLWLCERLWACFFCYWDPCCCCLLLVGITVCY